jgi:cation diffusion facilitator family transporter
MNSKSVKNSIILIAVVIAVNVGLAFAKMYVGLASNSLCIMLDSINSFLDVITCAITVLALVLILKSKGLYGRGEYLAGFVVSVVAVVLGGLFLIRSINSLAMPEPVWFGAESTAVMSTAIAVKLAVALTCFFLNKKLNSVAVKAVMLDSFLDVGVSVTSLASYVVSGTVNYAVDAWLGIVLSIIIVIVAVRMVADSVKTIVVGNNSEDKIQHIKAILMNQDCVKAVDLQLHDYGTYNKTCVVEVVFDNDEGVVDKVDALQNMIINETGVTAHIVPVRHKGEKYE